jgi:hypothetical protein
MTTITGTLVDNSGTPVPNRVVRATLRAASVVTEGGGEIIRDTATLSASDGTWSLTLTPTSHLVAPEGAYYQIISGRHVWYVEVPDTGTHSLEDVMVEPVTTPPTLMVTQGQFRALRDQIHQPFRLLTYYGIPELVNGVGDAEYAAQLFAGYDYVIFGESLQFTSHFYHDSTAWIIRRMRQINPDIVIFGYINIAVSEGNEPVADLKEKMDYWAAFEGHPDVGVDGIFFDLCGYEFEVPRARFNELADYAHGLGKPVFYNVFNWEDCFADEVDSTYNPDGLPTAANAMDYAMLESWVVNSESYAARGGYNFVSEIVRRGEAAQYWRQELGIKPIALNAIDYASSSKEQIEKWFDASQVAAWLYSIPFGVNALHYSAVAPNDSVVYPHHYDPSWAAHYKPHLEPFFNGTNTISRGDITATLVVPDSGARHSRGANPVYSDSALLPTRVLGWTVIPEEGGRFFVTDNPFDGDFLSILQVGDRFVYPDHHDQAGEIYVWDGDSWEYETTLTAAPAAAESAVIHLTP